MAATKKFDPGEPRFEWMGLRALRKRFWPDNPKDHDLDAIGEFLRTNGLAEFPTIDEGTGKLVAGHGRIEELEQMKAAGQDPPERVRVERAANGSVEWTIPVVRGMTFREPGKHVLASNRGVELGGWHPKLLAAMLTKLGDERLIGTGFSADDVVKFTALAKGPVPPTEFPAAGDDLKTEYCCPRCAYQWSGNPKPGAAPAEPDGAAAKT